MWYKLRTAPEGGPSPLALPSPPFRPPRSYLGRYWSRVEEGATGVRYSQEQAVLEGDIREGPVHQDHLRVLNVFPQLQQQEHSPAVQVWGQRGQNWLKKQTPT